MNSASRQRYLNIGMTIGVIIGVIVISIFLIKKPMAQQNQSTLMLSSTAFQAGEMIPEKYTCNGDNTNPALVISGVDPKAKSLAIILDDPDAPMGTFVHWVWFNIPATTTIIEEGKMPEGTAGANGAGKNVYIGPCPPSGTHHYHFKLYSLDATLDIRPGSKKEDVEQAMGGHIIQQTELLGLYAHKE